MTLNDFTAYAGLTQGEFLGAVVRAAFELTGDLTNPIVSSAFRLPAHAVLGGHFMRADACAGTEA